MNEPKTTPRICEKCEYFDIGLMDLVSGESDCHNRLAPKFQTKRYETCSQWTETT